ncbi:MAG: helix-hairpin-helix domain-containing protein [Pleurocapsa sp. MO_192.B19]|nr:helix-hairpin-helix domain-containing protein [Pleurocapsa sp. MO_192.B19]
MVTKSLEKIVNLLPEKIEWFRNRLLTWAEHNLRDYPWRRTSNPYDILVAEFLLQKTDADTVAPVYEAFLVNYPTLDKLVAADVEDIGELMKPLGLFFRAERLSRTAQIVAERYQGEIPQSEKELLKLPGIGKYTARAICSQAFEQPTAVMDTNVARILERFFNVKGERVKSRCKILWGSADKVAPDREVGRWNLTLLDFGAIICTARNPKCFECPLSDRCYWLKFNFN